MKSFRITCIAGLIAMLAACGGSDNVSSASGTTSSASSIPVPSSVAAAQAGYSVTLNPDNKTFHLTPVLMGNATANNIPTNTPVTLNMTDPDSMAIDPNGNLVVDSQQDSELVFVGNPGASQAVSVLPLTLYGNSWPVDDTRWAPAGNSFMLLADNKAQLIYRIDATAGFTAGTAYSAGQGTLLQTNTSTGAMTPVITGMTTPHGLIFVNQ